MNFDYLKLRFTTALLLIASAVFGQKTLAPLTVEKIMRDQKWIGTSPSSSYWSADGRYLFFLWNPDKGVSDSLYFITLANKTPQKANVEMRRTVPSFSSIVYNTAKTAYAYIKDGDLFYVDPQKKERRVTQTIDAESAPQFIQNDSRIVFSRSQNLFAWDISNGSTTQLTNFVRGTAQKEATLNAQEKWLQQNAISTSAVLQERKAKREATEAYNKKTRPKELRAIYTEDKNVFGLMISPDARFVSYRLTRQPTNAKNTIIPNYVTESGYTADISSRTNDGAPLASSEFYLFDREADTVIVIKTDAIPGITDPTDFAKNHSSKDTAKKRAANRTVNFRGPVWNDEGTKAIVDIRSVDNKDRWIMLIDPATGALKNIDRQRDEAWVAGPGISQLPVWTDEHTIVFQSESTGYSHIYKADVNTGVKTALTSGNNQ